MLSTQGAEIDDMVTAERLAVLRVFLFAAGVMVVLSFLLAGTIAGPMRRLAESAEVVRRRIKTRVEIPDFTKRRDEIGHLSGTLRDMTNALYSRIEAIESFAADVAHELKNPLTSLRSAVETLPLAKTEESRGRLLAVIQHDVKRLDRLISDISDASRLEAEMQRQEASPVDLIRLLTAVTSVANEVPRDDGVKVTLNFEGGNAQAFVVPGHDSRLGPGGQQPDRQCAFVLAAGRYGAAHLPPPEERGRDRRRRRRSRHPPGCDGENLRALLHRPAGARFRPEFGTGPLDLEADHRSPCRPDVGGEPHERPDAD